MSVQRNLKRKINHDENLDNINDDTYNNSAISIKKSSRVISNITCTSQHCDHIHKKIKLDIQKIDTLDDLIKLGLTYNCVSNREYNGINLRIINKLIEPLLELNNMIGLLDIKNKIIDNCLYMARGYNSIKCNTCIDCKYNLPCVSNSKEMLHTVITGPPGVGKTQFARILTKIYASIGLIKSNKILEVSRKDLISGYLGRTSKKTEKIFKKAQGGVIFIDEAYSLGNTGNDDTYSKECIDVINKNLSENRDVVVIIAGYEEDIENCFFRVNAGLQRRFPFRYNIKGYSGEELYKILRLKIQTDNWTIDNKDEEKVKKYITENIKKFPNYGGDIETLIMKAKIKNSRNLMSTNYVFKFDDFK